MEKKMETTIQSLGFRVQKPFLVEKSHMELARNKF